MTRGCGEVRERLHDWIDGTLEETERGPIRSHLETCAACRAELTAFERLSAEAGRLPRELRPPRDLWPGIEPRLAQSWWRRLVPADWRAVPRPATPLLAAGAALLALAVGVWFWRVEPVSPVAGPGTVIETASRSEAAFRAQAELARSEDGMLLARRDLFEAVERQKDQLSPETVAVLEENMRIIDQAIGQIRFALEEDPLNQQLHLLLAAHYQREVQLLKQVSGV